MDPSDERFAGIRRLYGAQGAQRIANAHICVVGIGGVGSWTAEALARSGVGTLTLIDMDDICITNTNRQIHTLITSIGQPKIESMAQRIRQINPACVVHQELDFLTQDNAVHLLDRPFDVIVDAIDSAKHKCTLLATGRTLRKNIVTVGGAGGRRDPSQWTVADLNKTQNDVLLFRVRKNLRQQFEFPRGKQPWGIPCVYTTELPVFPTQEGETCEHTKPQTPLRLDCAEGFGASAAVTGTAGFLAASAAIDVLLTQQG